MVEAQVIVEDRGPVDRPVDQPCTEHALGESRQDWSTARSTVQKTSCGSAQLMVNYSVDCTKHNFLYYRRAVDRTRVLAE